MSIHPPSLSKTRSPNDDILLVELITGNANRFHPINRRILGIVVKWIGGFTWRATLTCDLSVVEVLTVAYGHIVGGRSSASRKRPRDAGRGPVAVHARPISLLPLPTFSHPIRQSTGRRPHRHPYIARPSRQLLRARALYIAYLYGVNVRVAGEIYDGLPGPREPELHTSDRPIRPELHGRKRRIPAGTVHRPRAHAIRHGVPRASVAHIPADASPPPDPEPTQPGGR